MPSHLRSRFIIAAAAVSLMSSAALAQTAQPNNGPAATTVPGTVPTTVTSTKWMSQEAAGQWRTSKMIGLNIYNDANEKIGSISELIVDRSGQLEAVVVGVGGFLGMGEHDVAVPYGQIHWVYQPVASSGPGTTPMTTGAASTANRNAEDPRSYPDHAVLNMTKEQLKTAPAFKFSR
jgi:sporulation protein YlmC with PRC-barrel domain